MVGRAVKTLSVRWSYGGRGVICITLSFWMPWFCYVSASNFAGDDNNTVKDVPKNATIEFVTTHYAVSSPAEDGCCQAPSSFKHFFKVFFQIDITTPCGREGASLTSSMLTCMFTSSYRPL